VTVGFHDVLSSPPTAAAAADSVPSLCRVDENRWVMGGRSVVGRRRAETQFRATTSRRSWKEHAGRSTSASAAAEEEMAARARRRRYGDDVGDGEVGMGSMVEREYDIVRCGPFNVGI